MSSSICSNFHPKSIKKNSRIRIARSIHCRGRGWKLEGGRKTGKKNTIWIGKLVVQARERRHALIVYNICVYVTNDVLYLVKMVREKYIKIFRYYFMVFAKWITIFMLSHLSQTFAVDYVETFFFRVYYCFALLRSVSLLLLYCICCSYLSFCFSLSVSLTTK